MSKQPNRVNAWLNRGFFNVPSPAGDRLAAARMFIGLAIPSLTLLLIGHPELVMYAVFGAFTGMYGRGEPHQLRLFHQFWAAVFLCFCVFAGVLFSASALGLWAFVVAETLLAGIGSIVADRLRLLPAGPFFGLFAFGACAATPLQGPAWIPPVIALLSAACALAVGFAGWFRARTWHLGIRRVDAAPDPGRLKRELGTALMYVLGVGIAGGLATLLGWGHPYWAMASAAVPLSVAGLSHGLSRGFHRVIGTYAGLVVAAVALMTSRHPVFLVLLVIACQFPTELFIRRHYALSLVFFTPLILGMTYLAHPGPVGVLVLDRAAETTIGSLVGMLALFFFKRLQRA